MTSPGCSFFEALANYVTSGRAARKSQLVLKVAYRDDATDTRGATLE